MKSIRLIHPRRISICLTLIAAYVLSAPAAEWKAYYGNLHSHTSVSDGDDTPATAYAYAKNQAAINFLCLSEHNHMSTQAELTEVKNAALAATTATFVGLVGQEYSTITHGGNHVNIHDVSQAIPQTLNNNYRHIFREFLPNYTNNNPTAIVVCQFNHPRNVDIDYGASRIGQFPNYQNDWNGFVSDVDPWVSLIAILNGPSDSDTGLLHPTLHIHKDTNPSMIKIWHTYLERGFHLSPVADQDNHAMTWGNRTTARTGVWIQDAFNRQSLLTALKQGRCFATEDKNLSIWFEIDGQPMGSVIPDSGTKDLVVKVRIEDGDEPSSRYDVELYRDLVADGKLPNILKTIPNVASGTTITTNVGHIAGQHELFIVRVFQVPASKLDDAWTAPIWIDPALSTDDVEFTWLVGVPAGTKFIGSKNSKVYHLLECSGIEKIWKVNRVNYTSEPGGKTLHKDCPSD